MVYKRLFNRTNYQSRLICDKCEVNHGYDVDKSRSECPRRSLIKTPRLKSRNVIELCSGRLTTFVLISFAFLCLFGQISTDATISVSTLSLNKHNISKPITTSASYKTIHEKDDKIPLERLRRQASNTPSPGQGSELFISGFRLLAESESGYILEYAKEYAIKHDAEVEMLLFGRNFEQYKDNGFSIGFTTFPPTESDQNCKVLKKDIFKVKVEEDDVATSKIKLAANVEGYFLCYSIKDNEFHYGRTTEWWRIYSNADIIPLWVQLIFIVVLLFMSGIFSGLNLGLMALDKNELQVIERCGTDQEKSYARTISPVRQRGNYLLCTLLLGNVLVNSTLTIFMDALTSGVFAVIASTLSIVVFGEIIPQALCSRHGLAVGSRTIYITYIFMILTFPLSYPISRLLDKILGEEIGNVYDRERLMEYIRVTQDYNRLEVDEMNIISGALKFKNIKVAGVMTQIDDVFMLPYDSILNFDTLTQINSSGYSRIPVYEKERDKIVGLLHVKDLSLIDPDHNLPLKAILDFYSHPLFYVYEDVTLDIMLNEFKKGKSHMALVRRVIDNGVNDPYYELLGVVTLEDIIEELIQAEINDETDVISDNRRKQKRKEVQSRSNYLEFIKAGFNDNLNDIDLHETVSVSPQLALAAFRFLASSVEPFRPEFVSEEVLKVLMAQNIYFVAKGETRKPDVCDMLPENVLYIRGVPADYFIMILEGRARIIVTKEMQEYDTGPFYCFGIKALASSVPELSTSTSNLLDSKSDESSPNVNSSPVNTAGESIGSNPNLSQAPKDGTFIPDFTLFCSDRVVYLKVTRSFYNQAIRTTYIEKQRSSSINKSIRDVEIST